MWRRVTSLSSFLTSPSKSLLLNPNQETFGQRICRSLCTDGRKSGSGAFFSRDDHPYIAFVLGGPGSGKGTQCTKIVENFGFTHLSAGDLLRNEITSDSKDGAMIFEMIREGHIVPSEVTVNLLQKAISLSEKNKFLIDGFPRTEENRISYERIIGAEPNMVLFFDCPEEEMIKRVLNRNEGRIDDNAETVKARLKVFRGLSLPVVNYYAAKGKLHKIDGTGSEEDIFERVKPIFAALRNNH